MDRRDKNHAPGPNMIWSEKHQMWMDEDTRTPERKAADEVIAASAENFVEVKCPHIGINPRHVLVCPQGKQPYCAWCKEIKDVVAAGRVLQPCGHPKAVIASDKEGTSHCAWCESLACERNGFIDLIKDREDTAHDNMEGCDHDELIQWGSTYSAMRELRETLEKLLLPPKVKP